MSHSILSPSAAHRWLVCTPSALLEHEHGEDTTSEFAAEGTKAHAAAAAILMSLVVPHIDQEMGDAVAAYSDYVLGKKGLTGYLFVERKLDLTKWIPGGYGTADAIVVDGDTMTVIDLKYGKGVEVSAEENPQMMIYALGCLALMEGIYDISTVNMAIVQPRIGNISEWSISASNLLLWGSTVLAPTADKAIKGEGDQVAGDHCRFCKIKHKCRAMAAMTEDVAKNLDNYFLTPEEVSQILSKSENIMAWLKALEERALVDALSGVKIPGFKVVEGRSIRTITDQGAAIKVLVDAGYPIEQICKPQTIETLTTLEKLVGKKQLPELIGDYINKPAGKPTLVPESDKRKEYNTAATDFADLKIV